MHATTLNGDNLISTNTNLYAGAVNTPTTAITSGLHGGGNGNDFVIVVDGKETKINKDTFEDYFHEVTYDSQSGSYYYEYGHQRVPVDVNDLYVIDGNIGIFTTTAGGHEIYTGDVFGVNNEILITGQNGNGDLIGAWGAENVDMETPIGEMPVRVLQEAFNKVDNNIISLYKDDIKEIQVAHSQGGTATDGQGGTIGLQSNGEPVKIGEDKDGNPIYGPSGGAYIPGGITVSKLHGNDGKDIQIQFANEDGSFTVDAGSKVEANKQGVSSDTTLDTLTINGKTFGLSTGTKYSDGDGIAISTDGKNTISVDTVKGGNLFFNEKREN